MSLLAIVAISAACLFAAYWLFGSLLARLLKLDPNAKTPAVEMRDDVDYAPIKPGFLLSQHFSAIAAAGPIVGPILAGVMFGWLPALLWILIGAIFIGGVHDFTALVASIRHKARSIAEIIKEHLSRRSYVLFLLFVWIALVYIIVAFTDIVAGSFVGSQTLEDGTKVTGGGIATSSMLYLALPIIMGVLLRFAKLSVGWATVIFLPLVGVAIWIGQKIPLDLAALLGLNEANSTAQATRIWGVLLLGYCIIASLLPMWLLLQPRGHLGGYFLYVALLAGALGITLGGHVATYPSFTGWTFVPASGDPSPLFPMLFIVIACGACSGFHCLIASGTTSKQLRRETDAKLIGYGAMLLEGMVAVISLSCVMMLTQDAGRALLNKPSLIYAQGIGRFLEVVGIPAALGISFGLLAFTTFVYDTLDVCARLGRYIVQELTGWHGWAGRWFGTILTAGVPLIFLSQTVMDASGKPRPAWSVFWPLFGASNQLLAALALVGVTVWLWRTRGRGRAWWIWPIAGLPAAWMYAMSTWALGRFIVNGFGQFTPDGRWAGWPTDPVPWVAAVLLALAALILVEAIVVFLRRPPSDTTESTVVPLTA